MAVGLSLPRWDFYVAHGGADTERASALYDELSPKWRVFLAGRTLLPGDDAGQSRRALEHSAICVVLLSGPSIDDEARRTDTVAAIDIAQKDPTVHWVVPVALDETSWQALPRLSLNLKHAVDASKLDIDAIALTLNRTAEQRGLRDLGDQTVNVAVVAVHGELGAVSEAVATRLRALARIEELHRVDAGEATSRHALRGPDLLVALLGGRTGGTDVLKTALADGARVVAAKARNIADSEDIPEDESAAMRTLRKSVTQTFEAREDAAACVQQLVVDWLKDRFPTRPGAAAAPEAWELDYLRDRLPAWEQGRYGPLVARAGTRNLDRSRLYVSLHAVAQPWCFADEKGRVVVRTDPTAEPKSKKRARAEAQEPMEKAEGRPPFLERALCHPDLPFLVLQGEAGSGKTVLLQHAAFVLATRHLGEKPPDHELDLDGLARGAPLPRIPVLLEASALAKALAACGPGRDGLVEAVGGAFASVKQVDPSAVIAGLRSGRYLLLIDALDEVTSAAGRDGVVLCLAGLANRGWPCRVVLTTRPAAHTGARIREPLRLLRLAPLDSDRRDRLVERWCEAQAQTPDYRSALQQAISGVEERHGAAALLENPLLLTCLMLVYDQQRRLPDSTATLYDRMVGILCDARPARDLSSEQRRSALEFLFYRMQDAGGTEWPVRLAAQDLKEWRPQDLATVDAAEGCLDRLSLDTGLLRFEERSDEREGRFGVVRPWHRSFQEYLAACYVAAGSGSVAEETGRLFEPRRAPTGDTRPAVVLDPGWEGTLTFLVGAHGKTRDDRARAYVETLYERGLGVRGQREEGRILGLALAGLSEYPEYFKAQTADGRSLVERTRDSVREAFAARGGSWPWRDRVLALEALGRLGDPRLEQEPWVEVPGGVFTMGGDKEAYQAAPAHEARVEAFRLSRWPVTVSEYRQFVDSGTFADRRWWPAEAPSEKPDAWDRQLRHPNRPVVNVSWFDAVAYCRWASATRAPEGWVITLPTETEWEFAARGSEGAPFPWGDAEPGTSDDARANHEWGGDTPGAPTPVGCFPGGHRNGIWDLAGNVWEWCHSAWHDADKPWRHDDTWQEDDKSRDKEDPDLAAPRVVRGGSWFYPARFLRAACRLRNGPGYRLRDLGFRVVCRRFRQLDR
jgi:formylglycine-generating enzyme required for sulfatase activity